jgi:uncharacterized protein (DUF433 family)
MSELCTITTPHEGHPVSREPLPPGWCPGLQLEPANVSEADMTEAEFDAAHAAGEPVTVVGVRPPPWWRVATGPPPTAGTTPAQPPGDGLASSGRGEGTTTGPQAATAPSGDPAVARVLDAARELAAAARANVKLPIIGTLNRAQRLQDAERAVCAAVDALEDPAAQVVPLADHPAVGWLAEHLTQVAREDGAEEVDGALRGWLDDRQATGLDAVPASIPTAGPGNPTNPDSDTSLRRSTAGPDQEPDSGSPTAGRCSACGGDLVRREDGNLHHRSGSPLCAVVHFRLDPDALRDVLQQADLEREGHAPSETADDLERADGPGWHAAHIEHLAAWLEDGEGVPPLSPEMAAEVLALLADRDRLHEWWLAERREGDQQAVQRWSLRTELSRTRVALADAKRSAETAWDAAGDMAAITESEQAARRELAELRDLASQWKTQADALSGALAELTADRDRLAAVPASIPLPPADDELDTGPGWDREIIEGIIVDPGNITYEELDQLRALLADRDRLEDASRVHNQLYMAASAELAELREHLAGCVWVSPGRKSGEPCLGGTRLSASVVAGLAADGMSGEQIRESYPSASDAGVAAAVAFTRWLVAKQADALDHAAYEWRNSRGADAEDLRGMAAELRAGTLSIPTDTEEDRHG